MATLFPYLNPVDFSIWSILEAKVSTKKYQTVNALEIALRKIQSDHIPAACEVFLGRLNAYNVTTLNNDIFFLKFEMFLRYTEVFK